MTEGKPPQTGNQPQTISQAATLLSIALLFTCMGVLTSLNDVLIPHLKEVFSLNYQGALLIQLIWFSAFLLLSTPASLVIRKTSYQLGMTTGYSLTSAGCLLFLPAAWLHCYPLFLLALLVIAAGVCFLLVVSNPYASALGDSRTIHRRLMILHGFFAAGMTLAPWLSGPAILSYPPITHATQITTTDRLSLAETVITPYLLLALCLGGIAILTARQHLPDILQNERERKPAPKPQHIREQSAWHQRHTLFGSIAVFMYVGTEVLLGSFMVGFIKELSLPMSSAAMARFIGYYWLGIAMGRFLAPWFLHAIRPRIMLGVSAWLSLLMVLCGIFADGYIALTAITLIGLCNSVMYPLIYSLSMQNLSPMTATQASGILSSAGVGGGIVPLVAAVIADHYGIRGGFWVSVCCYGYILYYSIKGCEIATQETDNSETTKMRDK
ncbi:glucose/galactose MFS transporter [Kistimonas asteriae]|uniref:glucose/galactose MFS transporter n=1 Tax=Kistimonas asteriae TaxID=517724 RepID=UPI001BAAB45B|nr:glucose/galactose MFS transporter [Kistimonas asteriae]